VPKKKGGFFFFDFWIFGFLDDEQLSGLVDVNGCFF
jgi:hypothetical protein